TNVICALVAAGLRTGRRDRVRLNQLQATQSKLEESERRYRTIGEFIHFGVWQTNAQGELVFMSQSFLDMAGLELKDVVDGSWLSRMPRDDAQRFAQAWVKKDQSTGPWEFEYRIRSADGRLHNIHSRGVRMADDRG